MPRLAGPRDNVASLDRYKTRPRTLRDLSSADQASLESKLHSFDLSTTATHNTTRPDGEAARLWLRLLRR